MPYLTVRAWRSIGAPERTAAATDSPGSLPSITLLGIGENALHIVSICCLSSSRGRLTKCHDPRVRQNPDDALSKILLLVLCSIARCPD